MEQEFYSIKELAVVFAVHHTTIRRAIKRGFIIAVRVGDGKKSPYRISKKSIEAIHIAVIKELAKKEKNMTRKINRRLIDKEEDKKEDECNPCFQVIEEEKEPKKTDERTWISLGNRMFHIEDVQSMYIQANHLIINFDYTEKQIVIHFGYGDKGTENAKTVFECLRDMYGAYKINLPEDANLYPNLLETAYGDQVRREVQSQVHFETTRYKERHRNKLRKLNDELTELKKKMALDFNKKS